MTLRIAADAEAITCAYLQAVPEVAAYFKNIGTTLDLTEDTALPALRLTRVGGVNTFRNYQRSYNIQLESFATVELAAQDGMELAWAALWADEFTGSHPGGVVTGVDEAIAPRSQVDPIDQTPRWLAAIIVYAHPHP